MKYPVLYDDYERTIDKKLKDCSASRINVQIDHSKCMMLLKVPVVESETDCIREELPFFSPSLSFNVPADRFCDEKCLYLLNAMNMNALSLFAFCAQ